MWNIEAAGQQVGSGTVCYCRNAEEDFVEDPLTDWQSYAEPRSFVDANPIEEEPEVVAIAGDAVVVDVAVADDDGAAAAVDGVAVVAAAEDVEIVVDAVADSVVGANYVLDSVGLFGIVDCHLD